jgi:POT family proton-dependent oligopeptide transporter
MDDVIFSDKHPKGMFVLALTEMCQRFAFWGVGYLLVLFLIDHFSYSISVATQIFGLYTGGAFFLAILGAYIADKWKTRQPMFWGSVLITVGCLFLATLNHMLLLLALFLIILGRGLFLPGSYSLLGKLYTDKSHIREGGLSIYYALVNIGLFMALIILGFLQTVSWPAVFLTAAGVQLIGLIPYFFLIKSTPLSKQEESPPSHLTPHETDRIIAIFIMIGISIFFWIAYNQTASSITLFAHHFCNRTLFQLSIPALWIVATKTFFLSLLAFPLARLYLFLRRIKSNATPSMKIALSLFFMGLCFLVMQRSAAHISPESQAGVENPLYIVSALLLMALAELFMAPFGLTLVTNKSPHRYQCLLKVAWYGCTGIGFYFGGYIAALFEKISLATFFDIFVFTSLIPAFLLFLFSRRLDHMRHIDYL